MHPEIERVQQIAQLTCILEAIMESHGVLDPPRHDEGEMQYQRTSSTIQKGHWTLRVKSDGTEVGCSVAKREAADTILANIIVRLTFDFETDLWKLDISGKDELAAYHDADDLVEILEHESVHPRPLTSENNPKIRRIWGLMCSTFYQITKDLI